MVYDNELTEIFVSGLWLENTKTFYPMNRHGATS
jgi:hypothetical protein